jgi:hypothetical protein
MTMNIGDRVTFNGDGEERSTVTAICPAAGLIKLSGFNGWRRATDWHVTQDHSSSGETLLHVVKLQLPLVVLLQDVKLTGRDLVALN